MLNASSSDRRRRTPLGLAGVLLALAAAVAGCSGGSTRSSAPTTSTSIAVAGGGNFATTRARLTQCLESHGVPASVATAGFGRGGGRFGGSTTSAPPDSSGSAASSTPRPTIPSQYQAAFQACRGLLGGGGRNLNSPAFAAYRNCLQVHGVTVPSSPAGGSAGSTPPPSFSATTNPAFAAARQACASLLPARSPAGTTPSTT